MRLLSILLCLLLLTGCASTAAKLDAAEDIIETKLEAAEETVETRIEAAISPQPAPVILAEDEAAAIAIEHAGLVKDQIDRLRVTYEIDDGIPEYEVEFFKGALEYDYTIHAETGEILSFEMDD